MSLVLFDTGGTTVGGEPLTFGTGGQMFIGDQPVLFSDAAIDAAMQDVFGFGRTTEPTFSLFPTPEARAAFLDFGTPRLSFGGPAVADPTQISALGTGQVDDANLRESVQRALADPGTRQVLNSVSVDAQGNLVKADGSPADPGTLSSIFGALEKFLGTNVGRALGVLGLGGIGLALGQLASGGGERMSLPEAQPASPAQQASRAALNQALTQPGTVPSLATPGAVPSLTTGVPGIAGPTTGPGAAPGTAPGALAAALGPGATGQQDLQTAFRLALAGQRNLADLALAGTGRELAADVEQAPAERAIRLGALGEVPGLLAPTGNLGPALATGQTISRNITDLLRPIPMRLNPATGTFEPDLSAPTLPDVLRDPVRAALEQETLRVLAGQTPTPELEQAEREETQALHNRLFRQLGPGYELSTTGGQLLNQLRDSQQIRRNQYRLQTVGALAPQEAQRRQFGETATQGRLQTLLPAELQRAAFGEDVRARGLGERVGLTALGRTPAPQLSTTLSSIAPTAPLLGLGDAEANRRQQEQLQTQAALTSFGLSAQERAARAQGISSLFGTAAGTAFAPPSISLFPRSA